MIWRNLTHNYWLIPAYIYHLCLDCPAQVIHPQSTFFNDLNILIFCVQYVRPKFDCDPCIVVDIT